MQLHFRQYSEQGPPLLILHGLFGSQSNWGWHSKQLAQHFAVYGVDLRNHGDSPHSDDMNYPAMAGDIRDLLQQLQLSPCHVIGHSMGGKVAMQLALDAGDLIRKLLVVDIAPVHYPSQAGRDSHRAIIAAMGEMNLESLKSRAEADRLLTPAIPEHATRQFVLTNLQRSEGHYAWRLNLDAIARNYDLLREAPQANAPFDKPTLFVKGAESNYITAAHQEAIQTAFPQARIKVIMQAGHWLHADKPQAFQKLALDFLQED